MDATALVTFEDPGAAMRMAIELQRAAEGIALRIGVASGPCMLAFFRAQDRLWCTPLGAQPARAAEMAAGAEPGGIAISPETHDPAERRASLRAGTRGEVDFRDSEVDLSSLAAVARVDSVDILLA